MYFHTHCVYTYTVCINMSMYEYVAPVRVVMLLCTVQYKEDLTDQKWIIKKDSIKYAWVARFYSTVHLRVCMYSARREGEPLTSSLECINKVTVRICVATSGYKYRITPLA